ncbi:hypothetical protein FO519_002841 [Halicephalobus sp. NKZ332]|nr:hypothetical protein FO519_002841 [Halicephalobus sp. NKZ332]
MNPDNKTISQGPSTPQNPCRTYVDFYNPQTRPTVTSRKNLVTFLPAIDNCDVFELIKEYFLYLDQDPQLYSEVKKKAEFFFGDKSLEPYGYCNEQHGERAICALEEVLKEFRSGSTDKVTEIHETMLYSFKRYLHYLSWINCRNSNSWGNRTALEIFSLKEGLIYEPDGEKARFFRLVMETAVNGNQWFLDLAKKFFFTQSIEIQDFIIDSLLKRERTVSILDLLQKPLLPENPQGFDVVSHLSTEIVFKIFENLDGKSLFSCTAVNRKWRKISLELRLWKRINEIEFNGASLPDPVYKQRPSEALELGWQVSRGINFATSQTYSLPMPYYCRSTIMYKPDLDYFGINFQNILFDNEETKELSKWIRYRTIKNNWEKSRETNVSVFEVNSVSNVTAAEFNNDLLLFGTSDGSIGCYSTKTASKKFYHDLAHAHGIWSVALTEEGDLAFAGSADSTISVWSVELGQKVMTLFGHEHVVRCLKVYGRRLFSGSRDSRILLWSIDEVILKNQAPVLVSDDYFVEHPDRVRVLDVKEGLLFSGGSDGHVFITDVEERKNVFMFKKHVGKILVLTYSPKIQMLATGGEDRNIVIYNLLEEGKTDFIWGHNAPVSHLVFAESSLISGDARGDIFVHDLRHGWPLAVFDNHKRGLTGLHLTRFGHLVSSSDDGSVIVFDLNSKKMVTKLYEDNPEMNHVVWFSGVNDTQLVIIHKFQTSKNRIVMLDYDWPCP